MTDGPPARWFAGGGVILLGDAGTWIRARAGTADRIRRVLPGEWLAQ